LAQNPIPTFAPLGAGIGLVCQTSGLAQKAIMSYGKDVSYALKNAAVSGDLERVECLLEGGAHDNSPRLYEGFSALHAASGEGFILIVKKLLQHGSNVNAATIDCGMTALMMACQGGYLEVVKDLIEAGADVNATQTTDGVTPLMYACMSGSLEIVKVLLTNKADPRSLTNDGHDAFYYVAEYENTH